MSVDNRARGVAPVTIYNVAAGTHIVNIRLNGYSDWSSSVDITANQMIQVPATLAPGSGVLPISTRPGLSGLVIIGALAIAMTVMAARWKRYSPSYPGRDQLEPSYPDSGKISRPK